MFSDTQTNCLTLIKNIFRNKLVYLSPKSVFHQELHCLYHVSIQEVNKSVLGLQFLNPLVQTLTKCFVKQLHKRVGRLYYLFDFLLLWGPQPNHLLLYTQYTYRVLRK